MVYWAAFLLVAIGALNALLGYLIRYRKQYGLIAGYDPRRLANPERLARWVGGWSIVIGIECIAAGIAAARRPADIRVILRVFAVAVIVSVIAMVTGSSRRT